MIPLIFAYINFTTLGTKMASGPAVQWEIMYSDLAKTQLKRIYRQNFKEGLFNFQAHEAEVLWLKKIYTYIYI